MVVEMEKKRVADDHEVEAAAPVRVDRFGFVKQEQNSAEGLTRIRSASEYEREERRTRKRRKMIGVGGSDLKHYVRRKPHVVKRRIRKGITDCLRGLVWQLISGSRDLLLMNPGVYEQRHDSGQRSLDNVLKAYSAFDRNVGYVQVHSRYPKISVIPCSWPQKNMNCFLLQGMGFMAGLLLLYVSEEDAFWLLVTLLKGAMHAPMEGLYLGVRIVFKVGMALLKCRHDDLVSRRLEILKQEYEKQNRKQAEPHVKQEQTLSKEVS